MKDGLEWFAPKRYGYGAGLPIAWQGWILLLAYLGSVAGAGALFGDRPLAMLAIVVPATLLLLMIAARTTRGGWRWRWGKEEGNVDTANDRGRGGKRDHRARTARAARRNAR